MFKFHYVQMEPINLPEDLAIRICLNSTMFRWNNFGYGTRYRLVLVFKFHYVQMKQL